ncbi:uncharacterized protein NESG_01899 [Nematocida ausubeli]|uniref:Uncharacterized protein n=1 Tax=Nematocida ausubeli (strain ATCC PRA-371 / ERTm2) TaxID=1913371 RepID=A0A086J192_NEMA1|nr:uncharacterized protein NESG_01899 [Nematocida ausubeli]KFG25910.1 hypothetical protein NESG_01899 [Nematocida ausubeli]
MNSAYAYYTVNWSILERAAETRVSEYINATKNINIRSAVVFPLSPHKMVIITVIKECLVRNMENKMTEELEHAVHLYIDYEARRSPIFKRTSDDLMQLLTNIPTKTILASILRKFKDSLKEFLGNLQEELNLFLHGNLKKPEDMHTLANQLEITCKINSLEISQQESKKPLEILLTLYAQEKGTQSGALKERMEILGLNVHPEYNEGEMGYLKEFMLSKYKVIIGEVPVFKSAQELFDAWEIGQKEIAYLEEIRRYYNRVIRSIKHTPEYTKNIIQIDLIKAGLMSTTKKREILKEVTKKYRKFKKVITVVGIFSVIIFMIGFVIHRSDKNKHP